MNLIASGENQNWKTEIHVHTVTAHVHGSGFMPFTHYSRSCNNFFLFFYSMPKK